MADAPTKHIAARAPLGLIAELERVAESEDRTVSQTLRRAIRRYVAENGNGRLDRATESQTRASQEPVNAD